MTTLLSIKIEFVSFSGDDASVNLIVNGQESEDLDGFKLSREEGLKLAPFVGHTFELPIPEEAHV